MRPGTGGKLGKGVRVVGGLLKRMKERGGGRRREERGGLEKVPPPACGAVELDGESVRRQGYGCGLAHRLGLPTPLQRSSTWQSMTTLEATRQASKAEERQQESWFKTEDPFAQCRKLEQRRRAAEYDAGAMLDPPFLNPAVEYHPPAIRPPSTTTSETTVDSSTMATNSQAAFSSPSRESLANSVDEWLYRSRESAEWLAREGGSVSPSSLVSALESPAPLERMRLRGVTRRERCESELESPPRMYATLQEGLVPARAVGRQSCIQEDGEPSSPPRVYETCEERLAHLRPAPQAQGTQEDHSPVAPGSVRAGNAERFTAMPNRLPIRHHQTEQRPVIQNFDPAILPSLSHRRIPLRNLPPHQLNTDIYQPETSPSPLPAIELDTAYEFSGWSSEDRSSNEEAVDFSISLFGGGEKTHKCPHRWCEYPRFHGPVLGTSRIGAEGIWNDMELEAFYDSYSDSQHEN